MSYAEAKDVVIVASAGNSGGAGPPAGMTALPGLVVVSGIDQDLKIDPQSSTGHPVAIAAPYATLAQPRGKLPVAKRGIPVALPRNSPVLKQYTVAGRTRTPTTATGW